MTTQTTKAQPFFPVLGKTPLFSVNAGVSTFDALDHALIVMGTLRQSLSEIACQLEYPENPPIPSQVWALAFIAEVVEATIQSAMPERRP